MSARPSSPRRGRVAALTLASAAVLIGATAPAAVADPRPLDTDPCARTLAAAALWPGTMTVGEDTVRLVSDAYVSYLSRSEACHSTH